MDSGGVAGLKSMLNFSNSLVGSRGIDFCTFSFECLLFFFKLPKAGERSTIGDFFINPILELGPFNRNGEIPLDCVVNTGN